MDEYEMMYLPASLGGTTDLHPWTYLEGRMTYKNFLSKLVLRRQLFRFALREVDPINKNLSELILSSNYLGGCRLSYHYQAEVRVRKPADDVLTRLLSVLENKIKWNNKGVYADIMSPEFPALARSNRMKGINITSLVNTLIGDSEYIIRSQSLQVAFLNALKSREDWASRLAIDPLNLSVGFQHMVFHSSQGVKMWQRQIIGSHGLAGREIIRLVSNKYEHFYHMTKFKVEVQESDTYDQYIENDMTDYQWVHVTFRDRLGYTMLEEYSTEYPIQIVSQTALDEQKVRIYMKSAIEYDKVVMSLLQEGSEEDLVSGRFLEVYEAAEGLRQDDEFESESEDAMSHIDLEDSGSDISDFDDILAEAEEDAQKVPEVERLVDEAVDEAVPEEEGYSAPASSQGSLRQPHYKLVNLVRTSINLAPSKHVANASRKFNTRFTHGYSFTLPLHLSKDLFLDDDRSTAFEKLMASVAQLDDLNKVWMRQYILASLLNFGPVTYMLNRMATVSNDDNSADEDDEY